MSLPTLDEQAHQITAAIDELVMSHVAYGLAVHRGDEYTANLGMDIINAQWNLDQAIRSLWSK